MSFYIFMFSFHKSLLLHLFLLLRCMFWVWSLRFLVQVFLHLCV